MNTALERIRRHWVYVSSPAALGFGPCSRCGNTGLQWSTYRPFVWCPRCFDDVKPEHYGLIDGPCGLEVCRLFGVSFDSFDLLTHHITPFNSDLWPDKVLPT